MRQIVILHILAFFWIGHLSAQHIDPLALDSVIVHSGGLINTAASEFSPYFLNGRIVYVTEGEEGKEKDSKVDERYWDLRQATILADGGLAGSNYLSEQVNSPYHEGPLCFDERDSTLYFTRDNYQRGELKKGNEEKVYPQIFKSTMRAGNWSEAKPVAFLDRNLIICHPAIISEENIMIFSSNLPDGYGGMDLYKISLDANSIEEAVNLGAEINSAGHEVFPVYHDQGYLIYSSDGWRSEYKNYDLFVCKLDSANVTPQRIEGDFSSDQDDLGLYVFPDGKSGYFSSSRIGGEGKDDLYYFQSPRSIFFNEEPKLSEEIVETIIEEDIAKKTEIKLIFKNPDLTNVTGLNIKIFDDSGNQLVEAHDDVPSSVILSTLNQETQYNLVVNKEGYHTFNRTLYTEEPFDEVLIFLEEIPKPPVIVVDPEPVKKEVVIPVDVGAIVVFENIYYEYNNAQIKSGSADELDALVRAMRKNPAMQVRLVAHTDSRGTREYNLDLSKRRAESAKQYLMKRGIDESRIFTLGVGETQIRNHCKEGVNCSDRAHRYNRRTEVQIIKQ